MSEREVLDIGRQFLFVTLQLALPILLAGLLAGTIVSVFQAVTQIQEFTLTFVPKLLAVILALVVFGSWMLSVLLNFFISMFNRLPAISP
jgi:flagellar biosynthetic protein FliQ